MGGTEPVFELEIIVELHFNKLDYYSQYCSKIQIKPTLIQLMSITITKFK